MDVFNLTDKVEEKTMKFQLKEIGLPAGQLKVVGAEFQQKGNEITLRLPVVAKGQALVTLQVE